MRDGETERQGKGAERDGGREDGVAAITISSSYYPNGFEIFRMNLHHVCFVFVRLTSYQRYRDM